MHTRRKLLRQQRPLAERNISILSAYASRYIGNGQIVHAQGAGMTAKGMYIMTILDAGRTVE